VKSYVNLGCGKRHHPDWINIDLTSTEPGVIQHDLSQGIPLPDASCEVVYHAAVLEHMRREDALTFLRECHRVLMPGGIIRVGVPDLERLCHLYLSRLQAACDGDEAAAHDYDWIMLELYDQTVREKSGGGMKDFLRRNPLPNDAFVYSRIGEEGRMIINALHNQSEPKVNAKTINLGISSRLRRRLGALPGSTKRCLLRLLLDSNDMRALEIGRFRMAGEVHQWMYDRYSLARLLREAGFLNPIVQKPASSQIPGWNDYHLDVLPDGGVIKPDLFFMEATK
jgi:SAM-dependent methyltransferase